MPARPSNSGFAFYAIWLLACVNMACHPSSAGETEPDDAVPKSKVDADRAHLTLDQTGPPIERPVRPESLAPLSDRAARQIVAANELIAEQRFTEAALELERALRYDPNHPDIHRALAILHWHAGNGERAEVHAKRTLALNPADATAHYVLARRLAADGEQAAAIASYRTALLCPDLESTPEIAALTYFYLAQSLDQEGYLEAALAAYQAYRQRASQLAKPLDSELASLRRVPGGADSAPVARILERLGRYDEAANVQAPVVAAMPNDSAACVRYASLLIRAGRTPDALEAVRRSGSDDPAILGLLADIHLHHGTIAEWITDLRARVDQRPDDARLTLELARALVEASDSKQALDVLNEFQLRHPGAMNVRVRRVALLAERKAWSEALSAAAKGLGASGDSSTYLDEVLAVIGGRPGALDAILVTPVEAVKGAGEGYLRGALAFRQGRMDLAEGWLRVAVQEDQTSIAARELLARVYMSDYRYDKALEVAARHDPDLAEAAVLEHVLGRIYERLDDLERAELHFRAAVQLDRKDVESAYALAEVYQMSGRTLQAQRQLRVLLKDAPAHEEARELLARLYLAEEKYDAAAEQYRKLAELTTDAATKARCEVLLQDFPLHDFADYRKRLLASIEVHGATVNTWLDIAESYTGINELDQKRDAYLEALALDKDSERAALGLIHTLTRLLDYESAIKRLQELLPRRPNHHAWQTELIDLYRAIQDFDAALALAKKQDARPDLDEDIRRQYRFRILDTLRLAQRSDERLTYLKRWAAADGETSEWSVRLAAEYLRIDQPQSAVPIFEARVASDPNDRDALADLATALVSAGQMDRAGQYLLSWLYDDPESDHAISRLIVLLENGNRLDEAMRLTRNWLLHTRNREFFQARYIAQLFQAERYEPCIDWIESLLDELLAVMRKVDEGGLVDAREGEESVTRLPDAPFSPVSLHARMHELRLQMAQALVLAEEYREAEERLLEWADHAQHDMKFDYLRMLSICRQAMGDENRATEALEQGLALVPDHVQLNNDVAYSWIDKGRRLDEAERMIRYAVWRAPEQAAYLDTFAWLHYKKGDFVEAKKWLERAMRITANKDPVLLDHMGDTLWRLGEKEEAIATWTDAMALVRARDEDAVPSEDSRRVRDTTQVKIDAAKEGKSPKVAPLAAPADATTDKTDDAQPRK